MTEKDFKEKIKSLNENQLNELSQDTYQFIDRYSSEAELFLNDFSFREKLTELVNNFLDSFIKYRQS